MRIGKIAALLLLMTLLCGCSRVRQVESVSFAVILGLDLTDRKEIELTVQLPKISSSNGGEESDSESQYMIASATGETLADALAALEIAVPRELNLSQVKLLVVSETLASSERFLRLARYIDSTDQFYTAPYFAVCRGNVKSFISEQKPVIGMRVSLGIIAMFEHHRQHGYVTAGKFAEYFYQSISVYSDPVGMLCATAEEGKADADERGLEDATPGAIPAESEDKNKYVGVALFRNGRMVGTLDGQETCLLNALRGAEITFGYNVDGHPLTLQMRSTTVTELSGLRDGPVRVGCALEFEIVDELDAPDNARIESALRADVERLMARCQALGVEPFGLARLATGRFATLGAWETYDWQSHFATAEISAEIKIVRTDT